MRDERAYLFDMLESARLVRGFTDRKTQDDFLADVMLQDATMRRLAIIGEAASKVTEVTRDTLPDLPWRDIIRMRNVLVHIYFGVRLDVVWQTASSDMAPLIAALETLLGQTAAQAATESSPSATPPQSDQQPPTPPPQDTGTPPASESA